MAKILLGVSSSFCANFLRGQVSFLNSKGCEVIIISGPGEEISMLAKKENAKLITIPFTKSISPFKDLQHLFQIIKILRNEKPDIVNAGNPKSGFLIMLACWLIGFKRTIFTMHGLVSDHRKGLSKFIIRGTEKISCSIAKKVLVVSKSLMQHAINDGIVSAQKAVVIANGSCNGINLLQFQRSEIVKQEANKLKTDAGLKGDEMVIGFVGRITYDKGIDILFEVFNKLRNQYPALRLLMVGPIDKDNAISKKHLQQLYEDDAVIYLGKQLDTPPVYPLLDVLVLPSYREGLPNVLLEAAAMQVPVLATNIPGCSDLIETGTNGLLFDKGDAEGLYKGIQQYITNAVLRKQMAANNFSFVHENFSQQIIWQGQWKLYEEMGMVV